MRPNYKMITIAKIIQNSIEITYLRPYSLSVTNLQDVLNYYQLLINLIR